MFPSIFQLEECQLLVSWGRTCAVDWLNSALSPVVYGDIVPSINTQYNNIITLNDDNSLHLVGTD